MVYNDVPRAYQHTLKIAILEWDGASGGYCFDKLQFRLKQWVDGLPILKWRVKRVPLGINHPVWVQDMEFNMSYHIRRIGCPKPGDRKTFNELVSELYALPLDKSRPLWMMWVVEGLEGNKVALVTLFHHAIADGAGAGMIFQRLMSDPATYLPLDSKALGVDPSRSPSISERFLRGIIELPLLFARNVPPLVRAISRQKKQIREFKAQGKVLPPTPQSAPDSMLNTVYSHGRTFAYKTFELAEIKTVCKHFDATLNDMLVAIGAGAVRRLYLETGHAPDKPLVANIPINIRTEAQKNEVLGNYVTNSYMSFPIHIGEPIERLKYASTSGHAMKEQKKVMTGGGIENALELTPPFAIAISNWLLRRAKGQLKILGNLAISNVKGSEQYMYLAGARVEKWLSIGQVVAGLGLNLTAWSYADQFNVCVMAEEKVIPNGDRFVGYLEQSFDEFRMLATQSRANSDIQI
jgi:diacylglycerol O-acyltransferase / wax synthase